MNANVRFDIDDTDQVRPHVRLCHLMLSEALAAGFTVVELATRPGAEPTARTQVDGSWQPFMAFPPAVYSMLLNYFKHMAGVAPEQQDAEGMILVRLAGRDASVNLRIRRNEQGVVELVLHFPAKPVTKAAT